MSAHTLGPWSIDPERGKDSLPVVRDSTRRDIAWTRDGNPGGRTIPLSEIMANARLIAAAPDLLEELESMLGQYGDEGHEIGWQKRMHEGVRAAIAKARGEQVSA